MKFEFEYVCVSVAESLAAEHNTILGISTTRAHNRPFRSYAF